MRIKEISILCREGLYQKFTIGELGITEIKNLSQEYPDHSEYVYDIICGDKVIYQIIDVPVLIEFYLG